jgi:hypothetical protein
MFNPFAVFLKCMTALPTAPHHIQIITHPNQMQQAAGTEVNKCLNNLKSINFLFFL